MTNPYLFALERRDRLTEVEKNLVERFGSRPRLIEARSDIVREGDSPRDSCLLLSGFAARYHVLADGRRQISAMHFAGDFVDLHSLLLVKMDHSVLALTDCTISYVAHDLLREVTETQPHFARMLWLSTIIDAAIHRQWLVAAGRLSSAGQIAHFLCECYERLNIVGLAADHRFRLPLSQTDLSDAMGLSVVHVNRTVQELRKQKLIKWQGEQVNILDWPAMEAIAEFDPMYLNLQQRPR
jgi:CRP-like cAMP-binding protein